MRAWVVAIVLAAAAVLAWRAFDGEAPRDVVPADEAAAPAAPAAEPARVEPESPARVEPAPETAKLTRVSGRCVFGVGGEAGVPLRLDVSDAAGKRALSALETQSATGGAFEFILQHDAKVRIHVAAFGETFVGAASNADVLPGAEVDLGDLVLVRACVIHGVVREASGAPVAGCELRLETQQEFPAKASVPRRTGARTNEDSSYELRPAGAAIWGVALAGPGIVGVLKSEVDARAGGRVRHDVFVERLPPIRGRVLLADGTPAVKRRVSARVPGSTHSFSYGDISDETGAFELYRRPETGLGLLQSVPNTPEADVVLEDETCFAPPVLARWGDDDVVLRAQPKAALDLVVLAGDTGVPIRRYGYYAGSRDDGALGRFQAVEAEDGRTRILAPEDIGAEARFFLTVVPPPPYAAVGPLRDVVGPAQVVTRVVRVPRARQLRVRVIDAEAQPLADAEVRVASLSKRVEPSAFGSFVLHAGQPSFFAGMANSTRIWARAATAADGHASLALPAVDESALWVTARSGDGLERTLALAPGQEAMEIALGGGGRVRLALKGAWPEMAKLRFACRSHVAHPVPAEGLRIAEAPPEPTFRLGVPGTWTLRLSFHGCSTPVRDVEIGNGSDVLVELDAAAEVLPPLDLRVTRAGVPVAHGSLHASLVTDAVRESQARWPIADGVAKLPALPRGEYWVALEGVEGDLPFDDAARAAGEVAFP